MDTYKDQAEALYRRVERQKGANPTQKDVKEFLGKSYKGTQGQDNFIELVSSFRQVGDRQQSYIRWKKDEVDRIEELYRKYGNKKPSRQIDIIMKELRGKHTRQAVVKKRQRIIRKI